ncbi:WD40 repeat domain-containing protein [Sorangium sp. So ce1128]
MVAGARELLARNEPAFAAALLLAVNEPAQVDRDGWVHAALDLFAGGIPEVTLRGHAHAVSSAFFSPDGQHIVTTCSDNNAYVWRVDGSGTPVVLRGHQDAVRFAAFSPDSQRIVTASDDSTARVWNADGSGTPIVLSTHGAEHDQNVVHAASSPDDKRAVVVSTPYAQVARAAFNPDGKQVVTGYADGTACIFDINGSLTHCTKKHQMHQGAVAIAAFSPDGTRVVTGAPPEFSQIYAQTIQFFNSDTIARLWNVDDLKQISELPHNGGIVSAAFSPDGKQIITASDSGTAYIWNTDNGDFRSKLKDHEGRIVSAAFSPDGKHVVAASTNNTAYLWRVDDLSKKPTAFIGHGEPVEFAAFSPNGERFVTASADGTARVWNADDESIYFVLRGHQLGLSYASFSPDGQRVMTASRDETVRIWHTGNTTIPLVIRRPSNENIGLADPPKPPVLKPQQFSSDSKHILVTYYGTAAQIWRTDGINEPARLDNTYRIVSAAFSPDGTRIVTASTMRQPTSDPNDPAWKDYNAVVNTARVWGVDGSGPLVILPHDNKPHDNKLHDNQVNSVAYSPDGKRIVTASRDKTARVWSADGTQLYVIPHDGEVTMAAFSPDGQHILTITSGAGNDAAASSARVWRMDGTGGPILDPDQLRSQGTRWVLVNTWPTDRLTGGSNPDSLPPDAKITAAEFSPDGQRILIVSTDRKDRKVRVWSPYRSGSPLSLKHVADVAAAAFSPDGEHVVTASERTVMLWRTDGSGSSVIGSHPQPVTSIAFSRDGKYIVAGYEDGSARVWRADGSGAAILLAGANAPVRSASFSPDGKHIAVSYSASTWIWEMSVDILQQRLRNSTKDCLPPEMRRTYLGESPADAQARYEDCERSHGRTP